LQCKRALSFWAERCITIEALEEAHGDPKSKDFKPMISGTTLVESNKYVFFSMVNWGGESKRFREGMSGLMGKDFEDIVEKARPYIKDTRSVSNTEASSTKTTQPAAPFLPLEESDNEGSELSALSVM
jgi:hypothetical protein